MVSKWKRSPVAAEGNLRQRQSDYSQLMAKMLDEPARRKKAKKIIAVLRHFLGRDDLTGLTVVDIGCSAGYIADELHRVGARVLGLDIDVPGLQAAQDRFGERVAFLCAEGSAMPFSDASIDAIVFNHIYEHVVDADAVMREIRRVLKPEGVVYLGLGNRMGVLEPHYRLPFLSWLPPVLADRYVAASGRADTYYERFRTRPGLRRMCSGLNIWDYTYPVLREPEWFHAEDLVPPGTRSMPLLLWKSVGLLLPTYIWIGTPGNREPATKDPRTVPRRLSSA